MEFLRWLAAPSTLPQPLRVLDVGCGPGRLLPSLAQLGWRVAGMEPDPEFRDHAAAVAAQFPDVQVLPGGFAEIEQVEAVELVVGINSSAAHLLTPAESTGALKRIFRALVPGVWSCSTCRTSSGFSSTTAYPCRSARRSQGG